MPTLAPCDWDICRDAHTVAGLVFSIIIDLLDKASCSHIESSNGGSVVCDNTHTISG